MQVLLIIQSSGRNFKASTTKTDLNDQADFITAVVHCNEHDLNQAQKHDHKSYVVALKAGVFFYIIHVCVTYENNILAPSYLKCNYKK